MKKAILLLLIGYVMYGQQLLYNRASKLDSILITTQYRLDTTKEGIYNRFNNLNIDTMKLATQYRVDTAKSNIYADISITRDMIPTDYISDNSTININLDSLQQRIKYMIQQYGEWVVKTQKIRDGHPDTMYIINSMSNLDTVNLIATKYNLTNKVNYSDTVNLIAKKNIATAGTYTNANITIRNDGVITSISNGAGGNYSAWVSYPFTRLSDTLVQVNHNLDFKSGKPLKFKDIDSLYRYALITNVKRGSTYDTLILSGAAFYSGVDSLWLGAPEKVIKVDFGLLEYWSNYPTSGGYFDSLIYLHTGAEFKWGNSDAYLVQFAGVTRVIDVTAGTKLNVWKGSETLIGYKGLNMTSGNGTWMYSSAYYINPINYKVSYGNGIDLRIERADTTPDARNLTVSMWFILE